MGQITSRVSDELEASLNQWAADTGQPRADLIRNILTEAADARREGRAMFDRPVLPTPTDLQHLTTNVRKLLVELERVLRKTEKHDAKLAELASADAIGVSEARTAITAKLTAEMSRVADLILSRIAQLPADQVGALTASPLMAGIMAVLKRIEEHKGLQEMQDAVDTQTQAFGTLQAAVEQSIDAPRIVNQYVFWDRHWSGRKVAFGAVFVWLICVASYHGLARVLPPSWLAVRSSDFQTGKTEYATCELLKYRFSTSDCETTFEGDIMRVKVVADRHGRARR